MISYKAIDTPLPDYGGEVGNFDALREAIVMQAVKDYRLALYSYNKAKSKKTKTTAKQIIDECEEFFMSSWFTALTNGMINGDKVILKVRNTPMRYYFKKKEKKDGCEQSKDPGTDKVRSRGRKRKNREAKPVSEITERPAESAV